MTPAIRVLLQRAREAVRDPALVADIDAALAAKQSIADRIFAVLREPMTTGEIRVLVGGSQSHVWNELSKLEGAGLVIRNGSVVAHGGLPAVRWARAVDIGVLSSEPCPRCGGEGWVDSDHPLGRGQTEDCPSCHGRVTS